MSPEPPRLLGTATPSLLLSRLIALSSLLWELALVSPKPRRHSHQEVSQTSLLALPTNLPTYPLTSPLLVPPTQGGSTPAEELSQTLVLKDRMSRSFQVDKRVP